MQSNEVGIALMVASNKAGRRRRSSPVPAKRSRACLALLGLCSGVLAPQAAPAKPRIVTLTFSHFLDGKSFFQKDLVEPWAKAIARDSGGRLQIRVINNSDPLGDVRAQAANVKDGKVDIALGIRGAEATRFPGTSVVEVPLAVRNARTGSRSLWRLYREGWLAKEYADYKVLAIFVQNPGLIHTIDRRIATPDDMRSLRFRAPNAATANALMTLGAQPSILQFNEVMPRLDAGMLDGIITNWGNPLPSFDTKIRFHTDVKFYTAAFFIVMNKRSYAALPAALRVVIDRNSGRPWIDHIASLWDRWDDDVRRRSLAQGQTIYTPDAAAMAQWDAALRPAIDTYLTGLAPQFRDARSLYQRFVSYERSERR